MLNLFDTVHYNNEDMVDISRYGYFYNEKDTTDIFFYHIIQDWISPENLAYNYYGSCDYAWVILSANNIVDPFNDWLLKYEDLYDMACEKYGKEHLSDIHHFVLDGVKYPPDYKKYYDNEDKKWYELHPMETHFNKGNLRSRIESITNLEFEISENEKKRKVKILKPELLGAVRNAIASSKGKLVYV